MANDINSAVDTLRELLSSPDAGEKIESMLGAFMGGSDGHDSGDGSDDVKGSSNAMPGAGDIPIESIMKIAQAYSSISKADDPRVNLLKAIRPYVRKSRTESVDKAIKLMGIMRLAPLLSDLKEVL